MWNLILFKYMLYKLSMNLFVIRKLKYLIKGSRLLLNRKKTVISNKKNSYKVLKKHPFYLTSQMDVFIRSFKRYYFKLLLSTYLVNKRNISFCWYSFTEHLYKESFILNILSVNSISSSNLNSLLYDYHNFVPYDSSLNRFNYYSDIIISCSYDLHYLKRWQSYNWFSLSFVSLKEYKKASIPLLLFIYFISNSIYFKSTFLGNKNNTFFTFTKDYMYEYYKTYGFLLNSKMHFFGSLEYETDVLNIMFNDLFLLEFSRIWYGHYYSFFLKYYSNYKKCSSIHLFNLFIFFFDIEHTQFWLYKLFEDKAMGFYGYGRIFAKYKFKKKTEIISSPSLNSFDYLWASDADLRDLIVIEQSHFLTCDYIYTSDKKSFYNY